MKLVSFSVTNYRSITKAYKLPIRQFTVLLGPNDEGKSNILKALVTALEILRDLRRYKILRGRIQRQKRDLGNYDWERDFPISLQVKNPGGESVFKMEFELTDKELMSGEFSLIVTTPYAGHYGHRSTPLSGDPVRRVVLGNSSRGRTPFLATR